MQLPGSNIDQVTTAFVVSGPSDNDHDPCSFITLKFRQLKSSTATAVELAKKLKTIAREAKPLIAIGQSVSEFRAEW